MTLALSFSFFAALYFSALPPFFFATPSPGNRRLTFWLRIGRQAVFFFSVFLSFPSPEASSHSVPLFFFLGSDLKQIWMMLLPSVVC